VAPGSRSGRPAAGPAVDRGLELGLAHLRPALDPPVLGLLVELIAGAPAGAAVRPEAAPPAGGDVPYRGPGSLPGLAGTGPLLVHGPRGDLLGHVLAAPALSQAFLAVLV